MKHQVDVHLLCALWKENDISRMMHQSLACMFVIITICQRNGTLWEGRFKSCLVQSERSIDYSG